MSTKIDSTSWTECIRKKKQESVITVFNTNIEVHEIDTLSESNVLQGC